MQYTSRHDGSTREIPTEGIGYGSKHQEWESNPARWLDDHSPVLTLWCDMSKRPARVGEVWRVPGGQLVLQTTTYPAAAGRPAGLARWRLDGAQAGGPHNVMVRCPEHGAALVPVKWLYDKVAARHAKGAVLCCDPTPVYSSP